MKKKSILQLVASVILLGLVSCAQCFDERFGQDMIGRDIDHAIAIIGTPTKTEQTGSITNYIWFTDKSYVSTRIIPAEEDIWVDDHGHEHRRFHPEERVDTYHSRKAKFTLVCQGGKIINYRTFSTGEMCNAFIPKQVIEQYIAADKAAKAAR